VSVDVWDFVEKLKLFYKVFFLLKNTLEL